MNLLLSFFGAHRIHIVSTVSIWILLKIIEHNRFIHIYIYTIVYTYNSIKDVYVNFTLISIIKHILRIYIYYFESINSVVRSVIVSIKCEAGIFDLSGIVFLYSIYICTTSDAYTLNNEAAVQMQNNH